MTRIARLRRLFRQALDGADRTLHPWRHRAVLARLRHAPPRSILFVCNGNICRSPFAAALVSRDLRAKGLDEVQVRSAGIIGPDRPPPPEAVASADGFGVDLSVHRSHLLTAAMVSAASLIVVMDIRQRRYVCAAFGAPRANVQLLGDLDPWNDGGRTIVDPVEQPRAVFDACYARIRRATTALTGILAPLP